MANTAKVMAVTDGNQADSRGADPAYAKPHRLMSNCLAKAHSRVDRDHDTRVSNYLRCLVYLDDPGFRTLQVKRYKPDTMRVVS